MKVLFIGGTYQLVRRMKAGKPVLTHGDGASLWILTFNEDFAKGFVGLMGNIHTIGEAVQALTWNQIYGIIADALGVRGVLQYLDTHPEYQIGDPKFDAWCDHVIEVQLEAQKKMRALYPEE